MPKKQEKSSKNSLKKYIILPLSNTKALFSDLWPIFFPNFVTWDYLRTVKGHF